MDLSALGWSQYFQTQHNALYPSKQAGRVSAEFREGYRVITAEGEFEAKIDGKLRHAAQTREDYPAVGDWVACSHATTTTLLIHGVLPRKTCVARRAAGKATVGQIIGANVDTMFLVSALDEEFNLRRIERYVALARDSATRPVIVLNKADVCADVTEKLASLSALARELPVHVITARHADGVEALLPYLLAGQTIALVGSSGVGKSTIVNALAGREIMDTGAVRVSDSRGRHTTTHRCLLPLQHGALLLDTPGMRELHLWAHDDSLGEAFADIQTLAQRCRFRDCEHAGEPGCAVRAALGAELDPARLANYVKLQRELAFVERKTDERAQAAEKQRWKAIHKQASQQTKHPH
ncbi:MAG: ribosome small subunit-dependent GTPase A [Candidatus Eremiobacteraeota bacterium]|nr:ribosome small subunit-dependent GTPase A [Candidatus Eremiobacteraeota bacterium]